MPHPQVKCHPAAYASPRTARGLPATVPCRTPDRGGLGRRGGSGRTAGRGRRPSGSGSRSSRGTSPRIEGGRLADPRRGGPARADVDVLALRSGHLGPLAPRGAGDDRDDRARDRRPRAGDTPRPPPAAPTTSGRRRQPRREQRCPPNGRGPATPTRSWISSSPSGSTATRRTLSPRTSTTTCATGRPHAVVRRRSRRRPRPGDAERAVPRPADRPVRHRPDRRGRWRHPLRDPPAAGFRHTLMRDRRSPRRLPRRTAPRTRGRSVGA